MHKRIMPKKFLASFLSVASLLIFASSAISDEVGTHRAPDDFDDAIAIIQQINRPDALQQAKARAAMARDMTTDRIVALNSAGNIFLQTFHPLDPLRPLDTSNSSVVGGAELVRRREALKKLGELYGSPLARAAWNIQAGYCEEHCAVMTELLKAAGLNVTIVRTDAPHAFPVVNMAKGADPDNPWTWGPGAFVPDSWEGRTLTPQEAWESSNHFQFGKAHATAGKVKPGVGGISSDRGRLELLVKGGRKMIENNCEEYKRLLKRFELIPQRYRDQLDCKPPDDVCKEKDSWKKIAGHWRLDNGSEILVEEQNGVFSAKYVKICQKWRVIGLPDNATLFLNAKLKANTENTLTSNQGWVYAQNDCKTLAPYKAGTVIVTYNDAKETLTVDNTVPHYYGSSCKWSDVMYTEHHVFKRVPQQTGTF